MGFGRSINVTKKLSSSLFYYSNAASCFFTEECHMWNVAYYAISPCIFDWRYLEHLLKKDGQKISQNSVRFFYFRVCYMEQCYISQNFLISWRIRTTVLFIFTQTEFSNIFSSISEVEKSEINFSKIPAPRRAEIRFYKKPDKELSSELRHVFRD
jgi:hypothetical protein